MGMPALQINRETLVEERVAVLETHIEHIRSDVADLKTDVRDMRREMVEGFSETRAETAALRDSINSAKFWALGLYAALTVAIFGVMARGFGWI